MLEGSRFQVGLGLYTQFGLVLQVVEPHLQALYGAFGVLQVRSLRVALLYIGLRGELQLSALQQIGCLPFFTLDAHDVALNLGEFAGFDRGVRGVDSLRAVFDEYGVNLQMGALGGTP